MAIRKNPQKIKDEIKFHLKEGPVSTKKLSEKIESNWSTTNFYLGQLKKDKEVREIMSSDNIKFYVRTDDPVYYSLPFSKSVRDETIYLLTRILEEWKREKGSYPNKTTTQKIAVEVINKCDLDLPVLEFHYGKVTCMNVEPKSNLEKVYEISVPENSAKIIKCIKETTPDHTEKSYQERNNQYNKENMFFYSAKESLISAFEKNKDKEIIKSLFSLLMNFPLKLEEFYSEFNDFISISITILSLEKSFEEKENNRRGIKETFNSLWDLLTTTSYFIDAERYILLPKKDLFEQIRNLNINLKKITYENLFSELKSELVNIDLSELKIPEGEDSKRIQSLIIEALD